MVAVSWVAAMPLVYYCSRVVVVQRITEERRDCGRHHHISLKGMGWERGGGLDLTCCLSTSSSSSQDNVCWLQVVVGGGSSRVCVPKNRTKFNLRLNFSENLNRN